MMEAKIRETPTTSRTKITAVERALGMRNRWRALTRGKMAVESKKEMNRVINMLWITTKNLRESMNRIAKIMLRWPISILRLRVSVMIGFTIPACD